MSKMSDMAMTIEELRNAAAAITDAANWLSEVFGNTAEEQPTAPVKEPPITLEQVRAILAEKSRNGHTAEVRSLLQKYGASKLSAINPVHYKDLLRDAEVLDNAD